MSTSVSQLVTGITLIAQNFSISVPVYASRAEPVMSLSPGGKDILKWVTEIEQGVTSVSESNLKRVVGTEQGITVLPICFDRDYQSALTGKWRYDTRQTWRASVGNLKWVTETEQGVKSVPVNNLKWVIETEQGVKSVSAIWNGWQRPRTNKDNIKIIYKFLYKDKECIKLQ